MHHQAPLTETEMTFVRHQRVARLATSDAQGTPHAIPVCYAFDGQRFYTPLDEKPKSVSPTRLQRVRNIQARPEVALLIDQYEDDWSHLGYVQVHCHAELIDPGHEAHAHALKLLRVRYVQYRAMLLEQQPVIMLTPTRISAWGPALNNQSKGE
ncbi:TIGR03668 family PPOX class F420-dependent oxidoreductase [Ktedonobacter racemifer]|jgi:PPOX class probable F420-dependent enzyme|uniref:Putative F420-dependent enzyme n=1 Tax=Ktedonobacter racemifer DSM 44963 TaxID=485913 RepID=D6TLS3_KTERA|nr:TIGR03668 family PPOX class F420-dependent oxidoreductase [Ktedonobacter racemifer]EFH86723.1 putative F420-dependent enzyme [Ktedonobacter racemifer DSM 44963]